MNFNRSLFYILTLAFVFVFCRSAEAMDPEIVGSLPFKHQVQQALTLLKSHDTDAYAIVLKYIGRIQEGEHSGMWAYKTTPTYEMTDKTAFYSVTWCAATIAHDSFHSKLYHDYKDSHHTESVPDDVWTGEKAESECMTHQLSVMEQIGASQGEIDYAKSQLNGHYIKDYDKRNW